MKVVHICTTLDGGAGICAKRIINATRFLGIDVRVIVAHGEKWNNVDVVRPVYSWSKIWFIQKIQVLMNMWGIWPRTIKIKKRIAKEKRKCEFGTFTSPITDYKNLADHPWVREADIIHLHWIGNFVDYDSFFKNIQKQIVWTIHDENPGLGGFHYSMWREKSSDSLKRLDEEFCEIKEHAYNDVESMTLVAISSMMEDFFLKNKLLCKFPHVLIHNGIEGENFHPIPFDCARQALSIPIDSKVFLFIAQDIHEDRKGLKELIEALEILKISNTVLVCLGCYKTIPDCSFEIRCEGYVGNNRLQSLFYSAADYYVMPSFQEAFAQTPLEAMACGTPVVSFPCSGARDLIDQGNGVICDDFTVGSLAKGIKLAMQNSYDREIIRKDVLNRFSYEKIGKQYVDLYEKIAK